MKELEFRTQQRREEREHEVNIMRLFLGSQFSTGTAMPNFNPPDFYSPPSSSPSNTSYSTCSTSDDKVYFEL